MITSEFKAWAGAMTILSVIMFSGIGFLMYEEKQDQAKENALVDCYLSGLKDGLSIVVRSIETNRTPEDALALVRKTAIRRFDRLRGGPCNGD